MNEFALIILATLLVTNALDVLADVLNLRALSPRVPEEFAGVYDTERYARAQEYTRVRTRFGFVTSGFDMLLLLGFWFAGGFGVLDVWVRSYGFSEIITGLCYIGILAAGRSLLSLPFAIYSTFVIEQRFGFNRTTWKTFAADVLKGALLALLLGAPLLALVLWLFSSAGPMAWLYAWGAVTVIMLAVQYVAPTWIMPLFNRFAALADGPLRDEILRYAEAVRFPMKGIFVMDGSKRSTRANAFFTGFGQHRRIVLYDTLIEKHTPAELTAVLAHEIGHYRRKHILISTALGIAQSGMMLFLLSLFVESSALSQAFFVEQHSVYAALVFFGMLYSPVTFLLSLALHALSRKHEFEADRYAVRSYRNAEALIDALKKLSVSNLANLTPHPLYVALHHSHPPLLQRIAAIRRAATEKIPHRGKMRLGWKDVV
jgi:STE24 endopeptidase